MPLEPRPPEASVSLQALDSVSNPLLLDLAPNQLALVSLGHPPLLLALVRRRQIPALGSALPTLTRVAGCSANPSLNKVLHCLVRPIPTLVAGFSARRSLSKTLVAVSLAAATPALPTLSVVLKPHNSLRPQAPLEGSAKVSLLSEVQVLQVLGQAVPERAHLVKQGPAQLVSAASVKRNRNNNNSNSNNLRRAADYSVVADLASSRKDFRRTVTDLMT